jgi:hypothetical protein
MPYHNFTYKNIRSKLGITPEVVSDLLTTITPKSPSEWLLQAMENATYMYDRSEMARRELYIAPILIEVIKSVHRRAVLYSQIEFEVDASLQLTGTVDYVITTAPMLLEIERPVIGIAEAKVDNLQSGYGQCIAEMVASRIHNERVHGLFLPQIYGVVTDGLQWQFMELIGQTVRLDARIYSISDLDRILGILVWMIETQLKHIEEATP